VYTTPLVSGAASREARGGTNNGNCIARDGRNAVGFCPTWTSASLFLFHDDSIRQSEWLQRPSTARSVSGSTTAKGTGAAKPSSSPAATLRESVNVLFPGTEEIQKVHTHVFAGFAKAQQNQVVSDALFGGESPNDLAKRSEGFDGVLSVIVVPRYPVEAQECEELVAVLL
jgi:hypothetical protein